MEVFTEKEQFLVQYYGQRVAQVNDFKKLFTVGGFGFASTKYLVLKTTDTLTDDECGYIARDLSGVHNNHQTDKEWLLSEIVHDSLNRSSVDYIRSLGVALPWREYSVQDQINKGWVVVEDFK